MNKSIFETTSVVILAILLVAALYTDLKSGKIYNTLTIPCLIFGIAINAAHSGVNGLIQSLAGAILILALALLSPLQGGLGGGDIKLMMAIGALMGPGFVVRALLFSAVTGGLLALMVVLRAGKALMTIRKMFTRLSIAFALHSSVDFSDGSIEMKFRYSPAIALGTVAALLVKL